MKINGLKIFWEYIKRHVKEIILFGIFSSIFAIVFSLYQLPEEAVIYAVVLCICVLFVCGIFDFWNYYKKHKLLYEMLDRITLTIGEMPKPRELLEQDYQQLIHTLYDEKNRISSNADMGKSDMVAYYTLWVHQIKTPIAAMRLLLQSEETKNSEELSMELFKIEQYVEMVLTFLRIDSTSTDFVIKTYSLDDIVKQAVRKYAKMFIRQRLRLEFLDLNCEVLTDEKWLVFVVEQILSNALKYTKSGKISIYMEERKTLVIKDTGIGIQKEDLPRVFENGFTGYNGRTDKKSTGIGLHLCKKILDKLGHGIVIESEVDRGTKVKIKLDTLDMTVE